MLALNWAILTRNSWNVVLGLHKRIISLAGVDAEVINLESIGYLKTVITRIQPKVVIHTAALTNVDTCEVHPDIARHVNVDLAANVAKICADEGVQLVHISTDHLYAGDVSFLDEKEPVRPLNVYGRTKAEAELKVLEFHPASLVIRTNFYGWGTLYRKSFSDFIVESLRGGKQIELYQDVFYTPILIEDLVRSIHQLLDKNSHGIINLVGDDRLSKYDFGVKLANCFGLDSDLIVPGCLSRKPQQVKRPYDMSLSNAKARQLLGKRLEGVEEQMPKLLKQEQTGLKNELESIPLN